MRQAYFRAMGIPLVRGRLFDQRQPLDVQNTVVVNEVLARAHRPGEDPIGAPTTSRSASAYGTG